MDCSPVSRSGSAPHESTRGYVVVIVRIDLDNAPHWEPTDPSEVPLFALERTGDASGVFPNRDDAERFAIAHNSTRLSAAERPGELWAVVERAPDPSHRGELAVLILKNGKPHRTTWVEDPRVRFCELMNAEGDEYEAIAIDGQAEAYKPLRMLMTDRATGKSRVIDVDDPRPGMVYHLGVLGFDVVPLA